MRRLLKLFNKPERENREKQATETCPLVRKGLKDLVGNDHFEVSDLLSNEISTAGGTVSTL